MNISGHSYMGLQGKNKNNWGNKEMQYVQHEKKKNTRKYWSQGFCWKKWSQKNWINGAVPSEKEATQLNVQLAKWKQNLRNYLFFIRLTNKSLSKWTPSIGFSSTKRVMKFSSKTTEARRVAEDSLHVGPKNLLFIVVMMRPGLFKSP